MNLQNFPMISLTFPIIHDVKCFLIYFIEITHAKNNSRKLNILELRTINKMYLDNRIISFSRQQSTDIHLDFIGCGKPEQYN